VCLLSPQLNTAMVNRFLEQFAAETDPDVRVVMVWNQAGFHCAKDLRVAANMTILLLPPYSPELNPVENLWHYLRSQHWSNRAYADYDALREAACHAWQATCLNPNLIQSISHTPYLEPRTSQL
jgi:transposase